MGRITSFLLLGLVVSNLIACNDRDLKCITGPCGNDEGLKLDNKVTFGGNACTADPIKAFYPYKVLFVIDRSGSNRDGGDGKPGSDPTNRRGAAATRAINMLLPNESISFGAIAFSQEATKLTSGFTRERALLNTIEPSVGDVKDRTNYLATLNMAREMIAEDAKAMPEGMRARTRYDIQWLSDGVPFECQPLPDVQALTRSLIAIEEELGLYSLTLNTIHLDFNGAPKGDAACSAWGPEDYLQSMAQIGGGGYTRATASELTFNIGFTEISTPYQQEVFFLVNENRILRNKRLLADSDRDGVADEDEENNGSDAVRAFSAEKPCLEMVNRYILPNAGVCDNTCIADATRLGATNRSQMPERDGDGLLDCEEQAAGLDRRTPDKDGDGIPDNIEIRFGTDPLDPSTAFKDSDVDGITDFEEIKLGLNPTVPDTSRDYAYVYTPSKDINVVDQKEGTFCKSFTIDNVRLVETKATDTNAAGDNVVCLYMVQSPKDNPEGKPTISRSCTTANYKIDDNGVERKEPNSGTVRLDFQNFEIISCDNSNCKIPAAPM